MNEPKAPPGFIQKPPTFFGDLFRKLSALFLATNRFFLIYLGGSLVIILIHLGMLSTPLLTRFENIALDIFFRCRPPIPASSQIVYIEIAEDSFQAIKRLPWPRRYHAVLVHVLQEWKAKAVVFDAMFTAPTQPDEDRVFAEAIEKSGHVYLPVFRERQGAGTTWLHSLLKLEQFAKGTGHINITSDKDGVLRRIEPFLTVGDVTYPHFGLAIAFDCLGKKVPVSPGTLSMPLDSDGNFMINWAGKWGRTFKHYSYVDILRSFEAIQRGAKPIVSPEAFRDKICLIGFTAAGTSDIKAIPLEPTYPGVGVLANVINGVLSHRFIVPAPFVVNAFCLLVVGLVAMLMFVPFRNLVSVAAAAGLGAFWVLAAFYLFAAKGIWLFVVHPLSLIIFLFVFSALYAKILGDREKLHFFQLSTRDGLTGLFVMRYFRLLLDREIHNGQVRQEPICLILMDIDNFKQINDTYGHQAGDEVLKKTAGIIQSCTRIQNPSSEDCAARYGGEEFIVMLTGSGLTHATFNVAERIRKTVEQTEFKWNDQRIPVTISLGISTLDSHAPTAEVLIRKADEALYRAKKTGKNKTCVEAGPNSELLEKAD